MSVVLTPSIPNTNLKIRWREPYVSEGLNRKLFGVLPAGIYRGYNLTTDPAVLTVRLDADVTYVDHLAIADLSTGFAVTIRDTSSAHIAISLDDPALISQTVVVTIEVTYTVGADSSAQYRAYTLAEYDVLSDAVKQSLIVLGTVVVPASGVIPADNITHDRRSMAWKNWAPESIMWVPLIRNGGFEYGGTDPVVAKFAIPGWIASIHAETTPSGHETPSATEAHWQITTTGAYSGSRALKYVVDLAPRTTAPSVQCPVVFPVIPGQKVRVRFAFKNLKVPSAGGGEWDLYGLSTASGTNQVAILIASGDCITSGIDASYRIIDRTISVPAGVAAIQSFIIRNGSTFTTTGDAFLIDDVQVWVAVGEAEQPRDYCDVVRALVTSSSLVLEDDMQDACTEAATFRYDWSGKTIKVRFRTGAENGGPNLSIPGSITDLGKYLVDSASEALTPRIKEYCAPTTDRVNLLFEADADAAYGTTYSGYRIYSVIDSVYGQTMYMVLGATYNGSAWTAEYGKPVRIRLNQATTSQGRFDIETLESGTWTPVVTAQVDRTAGTGTTSFKTFLDVASPTTVPSPPTDGNFAIIGPDAFTHRGSVLAFRGSVDTGGSDVVNTLGHHQILGKDFYDEFWKLDLTDIWATTIIGTGAAIALIDNDIVQIDCGTDNTKSARLYGQTKIRAFTYSNYPRFQARVRFEGALGTATFSAGLHNSGGEGAWVEKPYDQTNLYIKSEGYSPVSTGFAPSLNVWYYLTFAMIEPTNLLFDLAWWITDSPDFSSGSSSVYYHGVMRDTASTWGGGVMFPFFKVLNKDGTTNHIMKVDYVNVWSVNR